MTISVSGTQVAKQKDTDSATFKFNFGANLLTLIVTGHEIRLTNAIMHDDNLHFELNTNGTDRDGTLEELIDMLYAVRAEAQARGIKVG